MGFSMPSGGGRAQRRGRNRPMMSEINVTPFVDVMLVLLIIFMVAAPLMTVGVAVDLPDTSAKAVPEQNQPLVVTIQRSGEIFLQETRMANEAALLQRLKSLSQDGKPPPVFIRADDQLAYGRVMRIMGQLSAAGFERVSLITDMQK